jgi:hypothetical protein
MGFKVKHKKFPLLTRIFTSVNQEKLTKTLEEQADPSGTLGGRVTIFFVTPLAAEGGQWSQPGL